MDETDKIRDEVASEAPKDLDVKCYYCGTVAHVTSTTISLACRACGRYVNVKEAKLCEEQEQNKRN